MAVVACRNRACATATGTRSAIRRDWRGASEGRVVRPRLAVQSEFKVL